MGRKEDDFESMFNEGQALDEGAVTEGMAAGLDIEEALEEQAEQADGEAPESAAAEAAEGEDAPAAAPAEEGIDASTEGATPEMSEGDQSAAGMDIKKEMQRLKSWEGRLKAREAELNAKEASASAQSAMDGAAEVSQQAIETAVAAMESQPIDEVRATLAEDFGDDFVAALDKLIESRAAEIAGKVADEKVGAVAGNVDQLVSSLTDERARNHFEMIADAHPDFMEVAQLPEFQQWLESKGEEAKTTAITGTARQVIKLLSEFKAASEQDPEPDAAMMAAQTVKGRGGMRLPTKPEVSNDYEAAWNSFS